MQLQEIQIWCSRDLSPSIGYVKRILENFFILESHPPSEGYLITFTVPNSWTWRQLVAPIPNSHVIA